MNNPSDDSSRIDSKSTPLSYPLNKVIGAIDARAVDGTLTALASAGFPRDDIDVIAPDDVDDLESPLDRDGLTGFLNRLILSFGVDLDYLERMRGELERGQVIVAVPVDGDDEKRRAADILRSNDAVSLSFVGRWAIEGLGGAGSASS